MVPSVILVDKPKGLTSFSVVEGIRKKFKVKVGHTGTLDPLATGLLILLINEATRYAEFFLKLPKEYITTVKFGEVRDTYDAEGKVVEKREIKVSCQDVKKVLQSFLGRILQLPPPHSAKRIEGKRAYKLARKGLHVSLKPVEVSVYKAELVDCEMPYAKFVFGVSAGTYIRSLVHDIGLALGCGAYVEELRRTKIGQFDVQRAITYERLMCLDDLYGVSVPVWEALDFIPAFELDVKSAKTIKNGLFLYLPSCVEEETFVRLYEGKEFIGIGVIKGNRLKAYRLLPQT